MPLSFQDWSELVPKEPIRAKCEKRGWVFPEAVPYLVKVYPANEASLEELKEWAEEKKLIIHQSRQPHVDLYGPNLEYALEENVLPKEKVREFIKEGAGKNQEQQTKRRSPEWLE